MGAISVVLLVFFVVIAVLIVLLVLAQGEDGDSLGGLFGGGSSTAFGSRSGNILTRITTILGALFLVISLGLALMSRSPAGSGVEEAARAISPGIGTNRFYMEDTPPVDPVTEDVQN